MCVLACPERKLLQNDDVHHDDHLVDVAVGDAGLHFHYCHDCKDTRRAYSLSPHCYTVGKRSNSMSDSYKQIITQ